MQRPPMKVAVTLPAFFSAVASSRLGRPVISANQASLWHCLRLSGVKEPVSGYGKLLGL